MSLRIEILISTMFKEDLDFLKPMFEHNDIDDFDIIIVNQTTKDNPLSSNKPKIKILNSLERGSPASRNLAIQNATRDICLMSDDDIVYKPNLKTTILEAYQEHKNADLISFEAHNEDGKPYTNYYPEGIHDKKSLRKIYTWVISFKREVFVDKRIYFNYHFGVGSTFKGCTEYVFLRNALEADLKMMHVAKTIVSHPNLSSGVLMGNDNAIKARAAMTQRFHGNLSYIWLIKYLFFLLRFGYIRFNQLLKKWKVGIDGIKTYKTLETTGEINRVYEYEYKDN